VNPHSIGKEALDKTLNLDHVVRIELVVRRRRMFAKLKAVFDRVWFEHDESSDFGFRISRLRSEQNTASASCTLSRSWRFTTCFWRNGSHRRKCRGICAVIPNHGADQSPTAQITRAKSRAYDDKVRRASCRQRRHTEGMQAALLREFRARHFSIRARWDALLRTEPVATPLALPDALVHLIDTTLEEVFTSLAEPVPTPSTNGRTPPTCLCQRNPYLAYFTAAEQALHEGLILAQVASPALDPSERDASLIELDGVLARISQREIEEFCGVCQFRHLALPAPVQCLAIDRW
jgi:hypothetical protein